jgi:hypothetical protein
MDLALNLVDQYLRFVTAWQWGNDVFKWIRQCETTFENRMELRHLLLPDIWPHAGRSSFVQLLHDKGVALPAKNLRHAPYGLENSVGLRLAFRQPPPIRCFSDQFLLYLNSPVSTSAYEIWAHMSPCQSHLPPERFMFKVVDMSMSL